MPPPRATDRLRRLLVMAPWLTRRGRVPLDEVAATFHVSREQAEADVLRLGMLGVPPYGPDSMVDVWLDGDDVFASARSYLARPPQLTPAQGFALLAAGRGLLDVAGSEPEGPLARALGKLGVVLGDPAVVAVDLQHPPGLDELRAAAGEGRRLRIEYYSAWRDEETEREIEPHVVHQRNGRWYVEAHDLRSGEHRRFRVDRIQSLADTGERFPPVRAEPPAEVFEPGPGAVRVVLDLPPDARWVVEAYPVEWEEAGGRLRVVVHLVGRAWLERLLLRVGADARVVEPAALAGAGAEVARRLLAAYSG